MRVAYLRSDVFYSFLSWLSSRQHLAFEMYVRSVLFVFLFIDFDCELILECISKSEGISVYNSTFNKGRVVGYEAECQWQRGKLCSCLISDSIFWLFYVG